MTLLTILVLQKQCRVKLKVLELFVSLVCSVLPAVAVVDAHYLCMATNVMPEPLPPLMVYLVLCASGEVDGMGQVFQTAGQVKKTWTDKFKPSGLYGYTPRSDADHPLLHDLMFFCLWCTTNCKTLWQSFGKATLAACLKTLIALMESHLVYNIAPQPRKELKLLSGRSGKKFRKIDATNRIAWLQKLRLVKFKRCMVLRQLTGEVLPSGQQHMEPLVRTHCYYKKCQAIFKDCTTLQLNWDGSMHTEDTVVYTCYSPDNGMACCPALQATRKPTLQDVSTNESLQVLHAKGKLKRGPAFICIKQLANTLRSIGHELESFRLETPQTQQ